MRTRRWFYWIMLALAAAVLLASPTLARASSVGHEAADTPVTGLLRWQPDGVPVATADGHQYTPQIVTDGAGGAIIAWEDSRPYYEGNSPRYLYIQRISPEGQPLWQPDGIQVTQHDIHFTASQLASDGQGGAIVAWYEYRDNVNKMYAQRIAPDGSFVWAANGLALEGSDRPILAGDGAGGAFVVWLEWQLNSSIVRAQHVLADGSFAWAVGGVTVSWYAGDLVPPGIVADGTGGAIVIWRGDSNVYCDRLYIQRVGADGTLTWDRYGMYGMLLSVSVARYTKVELLADGKGGATIVWVDWRTLEEDIYAQRVTADGVAQWASGGTPVIVADGAQILPRIVSDGQDGLVVAWHDTRSTQPPNVLLQRIGPDGQPRWQPTGVPVGFQSYQTYYDSSRDYDLAQDGTGGVMLIWQARVGAIWQSQIGLWLQRLSPDGKLLWLGGGAIVRVNRYVLQTPRLLTVGPADVILTWQDNRRWNRTSEYDIYAQRVTEGTYRYRLPHAAR